MKIEDSIFVPTKIAVNGFGRIGMLTTKQILDKHPCLEVVAVNDLAEKVRLNRFFQNDPVYGVYKKKIKAIFFRGKNPARLPWKKLGVDIVLECSGFFTEIEGAQSHLAAGAKKVIISAPSDSDEIPTYLLGVNEKGYNSKKDNIISMGSCTTNAVAPIAKVLDKYLGIKKGFVNTVHSYTNSQNKLYPHWRTDRVSKLSIIPSTTGATKTVEKCLPQLKGKLNGLSLRVPVETVSIVEVILQVKKPTTAPKLNQILSAASKTKELRSILKFETRKLVSNNLKGSSYSAIIDANLTQAFGDLVKVLAWYDNEYGYVCRLAEMAGYIGKKL